MRVSTSSLMIAATAACWSFSSSAQTADAGAQAADAGEQAAPPTKPKYSLAMRQNENWSSYDVQASEGVYGYLDSLKHISVGQGDAYLSIGGSARARYEHWENFGFGPTNDDGFLLTRVRLHADLHVNDSLRVFVEGKSAFSTDRNLPGGQRTLDNDELDLQQAFADYTFDFNDNGSITVRGGRQQLLFGKQRLVSPLPWANTMRAWDGVSAVIDGGDAWNGWKATVFWTQFAPVKKYDFNQADRHTQFYGVYATGTLCSEHGVKADVYFLGLDQDDATNTYNGEAAGDEERYTVGGRIFGKVSDSNIDYDVESAYQFGDVGGSDINAWMFAAEVGHSYKDEWKTRSFIGFDYASGDDTSGDGKVETFNQLYPLGHAYMGYMDVIGRQNIMDGSFGVSTAPMDKLSLRAAMHFFWRASNSDALYNAGGGVVRGGGVAGDTYVGSELDLTAKYKVDANTTMLFGYSHFFAGDFIDNGTPAANDDIDFLYAQVQWVF